MEWWRRLSAFFGVTVVNRRKFRSQTSDNMDRWKSRGEKRQGGEEKKWEDQKRKSEKKEDAGARKGVAIHCVFFQWFVAPEGRKVGSLKRRVRGQLARWEMKNCTPLWREAHFQVKGVKNWGFGPLLDVQKWQVQGNLHLAKSEQNVRVCASYNHQYTTLDYTPLH